VFYQDLSAELARFVSGLAVWDRVDETRRHRFTVTLSEEVPSQAVTRYEELFRQLAVEFPEIGFWASLVDHQATREEIRRLATGMAGLERVLSGLASGRVPDDRRRGLSHAYRAVLGRPVLTAGDVPEGIQLPLLGDAYVNPQFRAAASAGTTGRLAEESWWHEQQVRDDLEGFLLGYLTSPQAVQAPLLILGQPGSGKSVLTQVLAARLPPGDFLAVRVLLREVAADADLQSQIEHAIRSATGEALAWPDLSRSAGGALPVVLIDGFDELLQATAVRQTDYLRKAADFQAREATQGRPVAVLVTSRTAVADRAQPAPGMTVIRLEPFSKAQITQWLTVWNDANAGGLAARGLRPLPPQTAAEHADLASQPLLLLMLALYDADGNRLQHAATALDEAGLYERLLTSFAEREIGKSGADLPGGQFREAVERELLRLSVVAFAMFTRGRQWASEAELDADLPALLGSPDGQPAPSGLRAPLSAAQMMVGRFFFIYEARATRDNTRLSTYEFLHATFGEFLIARLVTRELCDLADTIRLAAGRTRPEPADDAFLHAVLSYMPLTMRGTIMSFFTELFRGLPGTQRQQLCTMLLGLFRDSLMPRQGTRYGDYAPLPLPVPARHAAYSANLAVLAVLTAGEVAVSRLFPGARDPVSDWRFSALLWRSQLPYEGWEGLITGVAVDRIWDNGERDIILRPGDIARTGRRPVRVTDPRWFYDWDGPGDQPLGPGDFSTYVANASRLQDQLWFLCDDTDDSLAHALEPLAPDLTTAITAIHSYGSDPDHVVSAAHALISLWVTSSKDSSQDELAHAYEACLNIVIHGFAPNQAEARELFRTMVLRQLAADRPRLPETWLDSAVLRIRDAGRANDREGHALLKIASQTLPELMTPDHHQDLAVPPPDAES
jgi:hypothetical protein